MTSPVAAPPPRPKGAVSPTARFRKEIEAALADGAEPTDLLLRLTLSDASRLLRAPDTALSDIRFEAGVMSFLGVPVQKGGVEASTLVARPSDAADAQPTA